MAKIELRTHRLLLGHHLVQLLGHPLHLLLAVHGCLPLPVCLPVYLCTVSPAGNPAVLDGAAVRLSSARLAQDEDNSKEPEENFTCEVTWPKCIAIIRYVEELRVFHQSLFGPVLSLNVAPGLAEVQTGFSGFPVFICPIKLLLLSLHKLMS